MSNKPLWPLCAHNEMGTQSNKIDKHVSWWASRHCFKSTLIIIKWLLTINYDYECCMVQWASRTENSELEGYCTQSCYHELIDEHSLQ